MDTFVSFVRFVLIFCKLCYYVDHEERHICFAEARFEGGAEGTNSADGTGLYFEGRATQVPASAVFLLILLSWWEMFSVDVVVKTGRLLRAMC